MRGSFRLEQEPFMVPTDNELEQYTLNISEKISSLINSSLSGNL